MINIKELEEIKEAIDKLTDKYKMFVENEVGDRITLDVYTGNVGDYIKVQGVIFDMSDQMKEYTDVGIKFFEELKKMVDSAGLFKPYSR